MSDLNLIKEYRIRAGLTQQEMGKMFGIPIDSIRSWETGRRKPDRFKEMYLVQQLRLLDKENGKGVV